MHHRRSTNYTTLQTYADTNDNILSGLKNMHILSIADSAKTDILSCGTCTQLNNRDQQIDCCAGKAEQPNCAIGDCPAGCQPHTNQSGECMPLDLHPVTKCAKLQGENRGGCFRLDSSSTPDCSYIGNYCDKNSPECQPPNSCHDSCDICEYNRAKKLKPKHTDVIIQSGTCASHGYKDYTSEECHQQYPKQNYRVTHGAPHDPVGCWPVTGKKLTELVESNAVANLGTRGFACYNDPKSGINYTGECSHDVPCHCKNPSNKPHKPTILPGQQGTIVTTETCSKHGFKDYTKEECLTQFPSTNYQSDLGLPGEPPACDPDTDLNCKVGDPPGCWSVTGNALRQKRDLVPGLGNKAFNCYWPPQPEANGECSVDQPCYCTQ